MIRPIEATKNEKKWEETTPWRIHGTKGIFTYIYHKFNISDLASIHFIQDNSQLHNEPGWGYDKLQSKGT